MIWFTSLRNYLLYSMENGIVAVRIKKRKKKREKQAISFGVVLL